MFGLTTKLAAGAAALAASSMPSRGAVYTNGTDLAQAVSRAQPYIAINGGPAVTVETYKSDGTLIDNFSGALLTSPDGKNRTVTTAAHGWLEALAVDPNAYAKVTTGTNRISSRGLEIAVSRVLIAPGADGSMNTCDLAALQLATVVPNTGIFVIGTSKNDSVATTTGVGFRLTQQEGIDGTYSARDGQIGRFDSIVRTTAPVVSDFFMNAGIFQAGLLPYIGVSASGNSGAGTFEESSFQFDNLGRITYGEYLGTNVGHIGDRYNDPSSLSSYTDANNPVAYSFLNTAIAVPEPTVLGAIATSASVIIPRRRKKV